MPLGRRETVWFNFRTRLFAILKLNPSMHIKKQHLLTPGPTPLYPKALHVPVNQGSGVAAAQRAYAECAIAKNEIVNA